MSDIRDAIARHDPDNMFDAVRGFAENFRDGFAIPGDFAPDRSASDWTQSVVVGMGGSAIGGDFVRTFCRETSPVPVSVVRDYALPASVGEGALVIASSYSGGTEETLAAYDEAKRRGATVYAVTSGGALQERAKRDGTPHFIIPGGMQPRAALGYSLGAMLRLAHQLGLCEISEAEQAEAKQVTDARASALANLDGNEALELARVLAEKVPLVYTGPGLMEAVGVRWMTQIQENAKQLAFGNIFAEMNHNEVLAWEHALPDVRQLLHVVVLQDPADHHKIQKRMEVTKGLLAPKAAGWTEFTPQGEGKLARLLSTIQLGDFMSFYLAMLMGVDPTPIETIDHLKRTLAEA
ncbi:MAG: bifunctional phosphoglucose/phosphomannose isomerase [Bacteroidota bacterium]